jgi:aspartate-semialdehyde dehydrogenase
MDAVGPAPVVAVVGATGVIGREILSVLAERGFPAATVRGVASADSAGERVTWGDRELRVSALDDDAVRGVPLVFLAAGAEVSVAYALPLARAGATVLDLDDSGLDDVAIPVVVPEVNLRAALERGRPVVVGTGAMAALAAVLKPLDAVAGVTAVTVATYEPVAGLGSRAVAGLGSEVVRLLNAQPCESDVFPRQMAFNCLPAIGALDAKGESANERGLASGLRRVLAKPGLRVAASAVCVPTFHGLGVALTVDTECPVPREEAGAVLREAPGLLVSASDDAYVTPLEAVGTDGVHVSRLREIPGSDRTLGCWLAVDSVRAAAVHAVSIAEFLRNPAR